MNGDDQDGNRMFPIHKPAHPKSLVHYVDLAPHRKKKMFDQVQAPHKAYTSEIKPKEEWF